MRLREEFQLYANLRPVRTLIPGGRFDNIDLVVVRENLEGLYIGHEHYIPIDDDPHAVAMATGVNTRQGSRRLLEFAFEHAIATGRKKVTIVHKANIMKALTGIFLETGQELYDSRYKGRFELDTVINDSVVGSEPMCDRYIATDDAIIRTSAWALAIRARDCMLL